MRKALLLLAMTLTLGPVGCGKNATEPVTVTPETVAEQKQAEQDAQKAESANRKKQKPERTHEQEVFEAESGRMRR